MVKSVKRRTQIEESQHRHKFFISFVKKVIKDTKNRGFSTVVLCVCGLPGFQEGYLQRDEFAADQALFSREMQIIGMKTSFLQQRFNHSLFKLTRDGSR